MAPWAFIKARFSRRRRPVCAICDFEQLNEPRASEGTPRRAAPRAPQSHDRKPRHEGTIEVGPPLHTAVWSDIHRTFDRYTIRIIVRRLGKRASRKSRESSSRTRPRRSRRGQGQSRRKCRSTDDRQSASLSSQAAIVTSSASTKPGGQARWEAPGSSTYLREDGMKC